nr:reverse transcriptase domain-containing protein [Tanacetum cinerariifolium]
MRTRSQSCNNFPQQEASPAIVEPLRIELPFLEDQFQEDPHEDPPEVPMADNRTMVKLLQAPTEGCEDAIIIPEIDANNFELKHGLINLVQNKQFFGHDKEDPHAHIRYFNKITSTMRVPNDSLNSAARGNFLDKMPRECLKIIESKSKVRQSRTKAVVAKVSTSSSTPVVSSEVAELKDMVRALLLDKKNQSSAPAQSLNPAPVKAVEPNCVTCGGVTRTKIFPLPTETFIETTSKRSGTLPSNTITNPKEDLKGITTRSGVAYQGSTIPTPSKVVKQGIDVTKDQAQNPSSQSTAPIQPPVIQSETQTPVSEPVVTIVSVLMPNLKPSITYPSRCNNERCRDQANEQIEKFYEIFKDMSFEISFTDALIIMPKFASTLKALIGNKEKLSEMARTPMNEHCSAVILNKLPKKLRDPDKFLIPCEFPGMDECLALADLGASINLMPLSVWEGLLLPKLTSICMTLELVDRSVSKPIDFEQDPRVPLILGRCFLKTSRALIDVHKGELTLRIGNEAITYNLDQTSRYSANYNQMTANKIDVIDLACEEFSQEVLGFSDVTTSGNPTPYDDLIISTTSPTLTPFGDSDFLLFKEADAFLAFLNSKPLPPLLNHEQYLPSFKKELKVCEAKTVKSSIDEPPEVELKNLPPHLEYAFLDGKNKLPVIIAKELGDEEKSALIKILMEEDYKPAVQHQRQVNPKIYNIIKKEVEKLLDAILVYPISDSPWVSPVGIDYQKLNEATHKDHFPLPFMNQMLERLAGNEFYCFLNGLSGYFQIPIDPRDQEKTTFTCPYGTFAYRRMPFGLCNAPGTFQRCMLAIFHKIVKKTMEVFMDDFLVFGNSFENCLPHLDKMLQRCEDTNLCLNLEKSHFMVKEGIVLGHKISKNRIEVDRAKVNVIAKLPHPITVKGMPTSLSKTVTRANDKENFHNGMRCLKTESKFVKSLTFGALILWAVPVFTREQIYSHGAIISDCGTHFCNDQFAKVMLKYGVTHHLSIAYHPQTSGQVKLSNCGLKRILERTIGENRASWSDKLDDALWAFRTTYKTPIGCTPYKLVYGKACHLPIELEHKAYWALKIVRIVKSLVLFVLFFIHSNFTSSALFWESKLGDEEKFALIKVLKSYKRAITWKLSDIQGINPEFCTHKILIEADYKPAVQHQRRVNPKIYDVIKKEVEKLLYAGLIYPISDSPWVSPVHCVPKKGGFTVVENEEN